MNDKCKLLFKLSQFGYTIVFIGVCISIWVNIDFLRVANGVFFVIYILNLWMAGVDTESYYDERYFCIDAISLALYSSLISTFIKEKDIKIFTTRCLVMLFLNEVLAMTWDRICHGVTTSDDGKKFLDKWSIMSGIGILIVAVCLALLLFSEQFQEKMLL